MTLFARMRWDSFPVGFLNLIGKVALQCEEEEMNRI